MIVEIPAPNHLAARRLETRNSTINRLGAPFVVSTDFFSPLLTSFNIPKPPQIAPIAAACFTFAAKSRFCRSTCQDRDEETKQRRR